LAIAGAEEIPGDRQKVEMGYGRAS
jgi:hypothetical protein